MKHYLESAKNKFTACRMAASNLLLFVAVSVIASPAHAQLARPKQVLELIQSEIKIIIPVLATLILICLFIAYSMKMCRKETFMNWGIGIIGAGMAAQIVALLYAP